MAYGKPGNLMVVQLHGREELRRDFDPLEWGYEWIKRNGVEVLRLVHDADPGATTACDFVEFSAPVVIEFEYEG